MKKLCSLIVLGGLLCATDAAADTPYTLDKEIEAVAKEVTAVDAAAIESPWKYGGTAGINLSQAAFSDWNAGGDPSIAFDALFNYGLEYRAGSHYWSSRLELAYGLNRTSSNGTRKTNDKIYFNSNYGCKVAEKLYVSAMVTFNTQFANGYDYKVSSTDYISRFMAPGYLSVGAGLTYTPTTWLTVVFSPATWRGTFVNDDKLSALGSFGVEKGKHFRNEFGANLRAEVNKTLWKKLALYSRLELYSDYMHNPQNIDVDFNIQLNYALLSWLTANLHVNLIYDDDVKFGQTATYPGVARLQVKEVFGIGLQVNF